MLLFPCFLYVRTCESINRSRLLHRLRNPPSLRTQRMVCPCIRLCVCASPLVTLVPPHLFVLYFPNVKLVLLLTEYGLFNVTNTGSSTAKTPRCRDTLRGRIATEKHVRHMPSMAIHVISHSVHSPTLCCRPVVRHSNCFEAGRGGC